MTKHLKEFDSWSRNLIISKVISKIPITDRELSSCIARICLWTNEGSVTQIKWQLKKGIDNGGWVSDGTHISCFRVSKLKYVFELFEKSERYCLDSSRIL